MKSPKALLRVRLRRERRALTDVEHDRRSLRAAKAIARSPRFRAGRRVAVYLPFDRETATAALIAQGRRRGVQLFVPVITDRRHGRMKFSLLDGPLSRGAYGIPIPRRGSRSVGARWFALIVVPVVGIDSSGRRLGMGAGFYDRATVFRRNRGHWRGPQLAGFAFDFQCVADIFAEPWDLRLDLAATESGLKFYHGGSA